MQVGLRVALDVALADEPRRQHGAGQLVNGAAGFVVARRGRPVAVAGFTVAGGRIVEIDILADPVRLDRLDLTVLGE